MTTTLKKLLALITSSLSVMLLFISFPVSASVNETSFEAVAQIEIVMGITNTYSTGLTFKDILECEKQVAKFNIMIANMDNQGMPLSNRTLNFQCSKAKMISVF